jgi:hypothetical protein
MAEALKEGLLEALRSLRIGILIPNKLCKKFVQPILSVRLLLLLGQTKKLLCGQG